MLIAFSLGWLGGLGLLAVWGGKLAAGVASGWQAIGPAGQGAVGGAALYGAIDYYRDDKKEQKLEAENKQLNKTLSMMQQRMERMEKMLQQQQVAPAK